jgi:hypothetical protein
MRPARSEAVGSPRGDASRIVKRHFMQDANERERVSLASGAGQGAPASEAVGESEGRSPADNR